MSASDEYWWREAHYQQASDRVDAEWSNGFWMAIFLLPFMLAIAAVFVMAGWIVEHGAGYRSLLESVLPEAWIATRPGGEGRPLSAALAVGGAFAVMLFVTGLVKRAGVKRWVADDYKGAAPLRLWVLGWTVLRVGLLLFAVPAVVGAAGIAQASDLETGEQAGPDGSWPFILTGITIVLWSLPATIRTTGKAIARRNARLTAANQAQAMGTWQR